MWAAMVNNMWQILLHFDSKFSSLVETDSQLKQVKVKFDIEFDVCDVSNHVIK